ncbi:MAG TPA: acyltransferase [Candidatus Tumulicola sp.]|nr:acyltransferase [Candidatus Tumulicola sp.]
MGRVRHIDGLRAVAVLSVVAYHTAKDGPVHPTSVLGALLWNGRHGVDLFFVLSGFCLSYPSLAHLQREGLARFDVIRYAAHRVVRIVPPYWAAIVLLATFFAVAARFGYSGHEVSLVDNLRWAAFIDSGVPLNGSFWTLPVEFRWYFAFPILLLVWVRAPKAFIPMAVAWSLVLASWSVNRDAAYLPAFALGIVAASLAVSKVRIGWWVPALTAVAAVAAIFLSVSAGTSGDFRRVDYDPLWFAVAFGLVLCSGAFAPMSRILSFRPLAVVGLASYSIYLVHEPIVTFVGWLGWGPVWAACIGIASGFAFWAVAERPFVSTSLRTRLVAEFEAVFGRWLPRVGITTSFELRRPPTSTDVVRWAEPAGKKPSFVD